MCEFIKQYLITPAAGKRLIAKSMLLLPDILAALQTNTVVIIAGTTNGYVAEEILSSLGQLSGFSREGFYRGIIQHPDTANRENSLFSGDIVIEKGKWQKGKTIFNVVDDLKKGDIIIKGANALDVLKRQAAVLIGHPKAGTIGAAMQAVAGRRVTLYIPVGLEKRVEGDLNELAKVLCAANASGPRLMAAPGNVVTELDAIKTLSGAESRLVAAGGVCGAEGSCWLAVSGTAEQLEKIEMIYEEIKGEKSFCIE